MIDHTGLIVSDFERARRWYEAALAPLGYRLLMAFPASVTGRTDVAGFGEAATGRPDFWISGATPDRPVNRPALHVAFHAADRPTVDAFHRAALEAGGRDNGAPGPRPQYHPDYYGAFVLDPDGHNIEAVCRDAA